MTIEETAKLLATIISVYPNYKPEDIKATAKVWQVILADYDFKIMGGVLKSYIVNDTKGFAPPIGELVKLYKEVTSEGFIGELEAWGMVSKAIRDGLYHSKERFEELPSIVQKAVGCPENLYHWAMSDIESLESVIGSNFIKAYRATVERESKIEALPFDVKALIEAKKAETRTDRQLGLEEMQEAFKEENKGE